MGTSDRVSVVGDRGRGQDLGGGPEVPDDVCDERVVRAVDARQLLQVGGRQARLGGVEAPAAGLGAEPVEHRPDRLNVAVRERADDDRQAVGEVEGAGLHSELEKPT